MDIARSGWLKHDYAELVDIGLASNSILLITFLIS